MATNYFWYEKGKGWTFTDSPKGKFFMSYATCVKSFLAGIERVADDIEVETEADDEKAMELYNKHTDSQPNCFPSWEGMDEAGKEEWRKVAATLCVDEGCDHHGTDHVCISKTDLEQANGEDK